MHDPRRHRTDDPAHCWFCKNFRLVPVNGAGIFRCENKNTPDALRICNNFEERELPPQSFEIVMLGADLENLDKK